MVSLLMFLCFAFAMFQAGYHWREWSGRSASGQDYLGHQRDDSLRDSMINKI